MTSGDGMPDKSKVETEIELLAALQDGEIVTQLSLSKRIAVSVGLVNALLKRAAKKGHIKAKAAPFKRYAYYLTPKGFSEKSRMVAEYLETSLNFFRKARLEYSDVFNRIAACGFSTSILAGDGELAEIAILTARESGLEVSAVLSDRLEGEHFHGIRIIRSQNDIDENAAVVLTESRHPQKLYDSLIENVNPDRVYFPALMKVVQQTSQSVSGEEQGSAEKGGRA